MPNVRKENVPAVSRQFFRGHRASRALSILFGCLLGGCTTLRTSVEPVDEPTHGGDRHARVGIHYFLPKALITIEGKGVVTDPAQPVQVFNITVSRSLVADRRHRYHLRWTQNPFYDDKVTATPGIAVNDNGLLTTVDFSATDQTPEIAKDLASTAVNVFRILGQTGPVEKRGAPGAPDPLTPFKYTFDPLDAAETHEVERALKKMDIGLVLIRPPARGTQSEIGTAMAHSDWKNDAPPDEQGAELPRSGGVFYHPPTTIEMRFDFRPGAKVVHRETITVPDIAHVACFRFGRSPLVKRDTTLALVSGMPSSFKIDRPSPVKGLATGLKDVTGIIADAIPTIVNVRVNREISDLEARTRLAEARAGLAEKQASVLEKEKALADAIAAANAAAATPPKDPDPKKKDNEGTPGTGDKLPKSPIKFEGSVTLPE